ncbi:MAG TPA: hypothetical protein VG184_05590 [Acidimicrobiales bacterium]|nr:hypothetical protein [Acidimicrobiales bacterium]
MRRRVLVAALGALVLAGCGSTTKVNSGTSPGTTIAIQILSSDRYQPATVTVTPGEKVVFKVSNHATGIHQFVLGDTTVQDSYEKLMMGMGSSPMAMPDQSNVLSLQAGQTKQLAWTAPTTGGATVIYGSHEPGDYANGLKGLITVTGGTAGAATSTTMGNMGTTSTTMGNMGGGTSTTMGNMGGMTSTSG